MIVKICIFLFVMFLICLCFRKNVYEPYDNCDPSSPSSHLGIQDCDSRLVCSDRMIYGDGPSRANCDIQSHTVFHSIEPSSVFKDITDSNFIKKLHLREQLANSKALMNIVTSTDESGEETTTRSLKRNDLHTELYENMSFIVRVSEQRHSNDTPELIADRTLYRDDSDYFLSSIGPFTVGDVQTLFVEDRGYTLEDFQFDVPDGPLENAFFRSYDYLVSYFEQECKLLNGRNSYDMEGISGNTSYYNIRKLYKSIKAISDVSGGVLVPTIDGVVVDEGATLPPIIEDSNIQFASSPLVTVPFGEFLMLGGCPDTSNQALVISTLSEKIENSIVSRHEEAREDSEGRLNDVTHYNDFQSMLQQAHSISENWGHPIDTYNALSGDTAAEEDEAAAEEAAEAAEVRATALKLLYHQQLIYNLFLIARKIEDIDLLLSYIPLFKLEFGGHSGFSIPECVGTGLPVSSPTCSEVNPIDMCSQSFEVSEGNYSQCGGTSVCGVVSECIVLDELDDIHRNIRDYPEQFINISNQILLPNTPNISDSENIDEKINQLTNIHEEYIEKKLDALNSLEHLTSDDSWGDVATLVVDILNTEDLCTIGGDTVTLFGNADSGESVASRCGTMKDSIETVQGYFDNFEKVKTKVKSLLKEEAILKEEFEVLRQVKLMKAWGGSSGAPSEREMSRKMSTWITNLGEDSVSSISSERAAELLTVIEDEQRLTDELHATSGLMRGKKMSKMLETAGQISDRISRPINSVLEYKNSLATVYENSKVARAYARIVEAGGSSLFGKIGSKALRFIMSDLFTGLVMSIDIMEWALGDMSPDVAYTIGEGHITDSHISSAFQILSPISHLLPPNTPGLDTSIHPDGLSGISAKYTYQTMADIEMAMSKISWVDPEFYIIQMILSSAQVYAGMALIRRGSFPEGSCLRMKPDLCYRTSIVLPIREKVDECNAYQRASVAVDTSNHREDLGNENIYIGSSTIDLVEISDSAGGEEVTEEKDLHYLWVGTSELQQNVFNGVTAVFDAIEHFEKPDWLFHTPDKCIRAKTHKNSGHIYGNDGTRIFNYIAQECPDAKMFVDPSFSGSRIKTKLEKELDETSPDDYINIRSGDLDTDDIIHRFRGTGMCLPGSDCYRMRRMLAATERETDKSSVLYSGEHMCTTMVCGEQDDNTICNDNYCIGCCDGAARSDFTDESSDAPRGDARMYEQAEKVGYCLDNDDGPDGCAEKSTSINAEIATLNILQKLDPLNNRPRYTVAELREYDSNYNNREDRDLLISTTCGEFEAERINRYTGDSTCVPVCGPSAAYRMWGYNPVEDASGTVIRCDEVQTCTCSDGTPARGLNCDLYGSTDHRCCLGGESRGAAEKCAVCDTNYYLYGGRCYEKKESGSVSASGSFCKSGSTRGCDWSDKLNAFSVCFRAPQVPSVVQVCA